MSRWFVPDRLRAVIPRPHRDGRRESRRIPCPTAAASSTGKTPGNRTGAGGRSRRFVALPLIGLLSLSCNGGPNNGPGPGPDPTLTGIAIVGGNQIEGRGQSLQLRANAVFSDGTSVDVTSDTRWTTSDSSILTVSDTGLVTAIGYGIAEVRAVYGAYSAAISVTVSLPAATALAIRGGGAPIRGINQTLQLRADVTLADGTVLDGTTSSTWRSSNSSVAVVRSDGLVTSVGFGTTQISVDYQRLTASILITVVAATVTFTAISEGGNTSRPFDLGGVAFQRDGRTFYSGTGGGGGGRGINIAAIDGRSGGLMGRAMNFDTWATRASGSGMVALIEFINRQPNGTLLLVAVGDEGGLTQDSPDCLPNPTRDSICCRPLGYSWTENGLRTLEALGARQIRQYCYRNSYALIAVKGEGAKAEALANGRQVTVQHALMVR